MKIKKNILIIILCTVMLIGLTGCFGGLEVNKRAFVQLIGIDKTDDMYVVSIQLYHSESDSPSPSISGANMKTTVGEGFTISSAISDAERRYGRQFFLGHTKLLIISDKISNPASDLDVFLNSNISPGCPVVFSNNPEEIISTKLEDSVFSAEYLLELMDSAARHGESIYTPLTTLAANTTVLDTACVLSVLSSDGETILFDGLTFADRNKVFPQTEIPNTDVPGVKILMNGFNKGDRYTIPVSVGNKTASVAIVDCKTSKSADIVDGNLRITVNVHLSMQIIENKFGLENKIIENAVRESVNDTIISAFSTAVWYNKCDIFDIYKLIRRYCPNYIDVYNNDHSNMLENCILDIKIDDRVIG